MLRFANKIPSLMLFVSAAATAAVIHEQLLFVVAEDMNASTASLQRYAYQNGTWEKEGNAIAVNVGRNGLGWGLGSMSLPHEETDPVKHEGDGRAPAGIFELGPVFGYAAALDTAMPYRQATADLICIDDSRSASYNKIVPITPALEFASFEWMHRDDGLYRMGVVVRHNGEALPGRGSCIFLHIQRAAGAGTAGCTSMAAPALHTVIRWLVPAKKPLLVQIPAKMLPAAKKMLMTETPPEASGSRAVQ